MKITVYGQVDDGSIHPVITVEDDDAETAKTELAATLRAWAAETDPDASFMELILRYDEESGPVTGNVIPPRVLAAESRRAFRQLMEDSSLGCPNSPRCFRMLVDHTHQGWDADGNPINPRCPEDR